MKLFVAHSMTDIVNVYLATLESEDARAPHVLRTRAESARRARRLRSDMARGIDMAGGLNSFLRTLAVVTPAYYAHRSLELPKEVPNVRQQRVYL